MAPTTKPRHSRAPLGLPGRQGRYLLQPCIVLLPLALRRIGGSGQHHYLIRLVPRGEVLEENAPHFLDDFGLALATVAAADDEFRFRIVHVRAGVFDDAIAAGGRLVSLVESDDGVRYDAVGGRQIGQRE